MINGLLGKKLGMTQVFLADGTRVAVTVIEAGPCVVVQKKTADNDGYSALQLGFGEKKAHRVSKPLVGHFKAADKGAFAHLKEFRTATDAEMGVGDEVNCTIFVAGEKIDVTAISKGKGFQGVIKRYNFSGGRATHGSMFHRAPGSIGASAWPSRVFKGKKMPGQMGNKQVTVQNLVVVDVRPEQNLLLVRGAVPGPKNGLVTIRKGIKVAGK